MQDPIGSYKINLEFLQDPTTFDLGSYQDPVGMLLYMKILSGSS